MSGRESADKSEAEAVDVLLGRVSGVTAEGPSAPRPSGVRATLLGDMLYGAPSWQRQSGQEDGCDGGGGAGAGGKRGGGGGGGVDGGCKAVSGRCG